MSEQAADRPEQNRKHYLQIMHDTISSFLGKEIVLNDTHRPIKLAPGDFWNMFLVNC